MSRAHDNPQSRLSEIMTGSELLTGGSVRDIVLSSGIPAFDAAVLPSSRDDFKDYLVQLFTLNPTGVGCQAEISEEDDADFKLRTENVAPIAAHINENPGVNVKDYINEIVANNSYPDLIAYSKRKVAARDGSSEETYNEIAKCYQKNTSNNGLKPYVLVIEGPGALNQAIEKERLFFQKLEEEDKLPAGVDSAAKRTFYVNYNESGHWIAAQIVLGNRDAAGLRSIQVNRVNSVSGTSFTGAVAAGDGVNYSSIQNSHFYTKQQSKDSGPLTTCGIRAAVNTVALINGTAVANLPQEAEAALRLRIAKQVANYHKIAFDPKKYAKPEKSGLGSGSGKGANPELPTPPIAVEPEESNRSGSDENSNGNAARQSNEIARTDSQLASVSKELEALAMKGGNREGQAVKGYTDEERKKIDEEIAKINKDGKKIPDHIAEGLINGYKNTALAEATEKDKALIHGFFDAIIGMIGHDDDPKKKKGLSAAIDGLSGEAALPMVMGLFHAFKCVLEAALGVGVNLLQAVKKINAIEEKEQGILKGENAIRQARNNTGSFVERCAAAPDHSNTFASSVRNNSGRTLV